MRTFVAHDKSSCQDPPENSKSGRSACLGRTVRCLHSDLDRVEFVSEQIQLISGGPSAVYWRTVRGILVDRPRLLSGHTIGVTEAYRCIWRTVRGPWADCPRCNFLLITASSEKLMNGGPSASYPRTVRTTNFQTAQNFANFHNFNFEFGLLLM